MQGLGGPVSSDVLKDLENIAVRPDQTPTNLLGDGWTSARPQAGEKTELP